VSEDRAGPKQGLIFSLKSINQYATSPPPPPPPPPKNQHPTTKQTKEGKKQAHTKKTNNFSPKKKKKKTPPPPPPPSSKHKTQLIIGQTDLYDLVTKKEIFHHFLKSLESNPLHLQEV